MVHYVKQRIDGKTLFDLLYGMRNGGRMEYIHGNGDGLVIIIVFSECFKLLFESLAIGENGGSKIYLKKIRLNCTF